eukprot:TRINITY_DN40074_c0_g1_i2.p1 TRINITY_DN40074_c0_g1~~TRINITY_DN40074_c0_g1_i2.p1  ORF type:complete len:171 (+),score=23.38 TRINITY_DN40074_c0_g1_i2:143-655(+)
MHRLGNLEREGSARSSSAPPNLEELTASSGLNGGPLEGEEYRYDPEYYVYYYSQRPLDPRLLTPLCSSAALQQHTHRVAQPMPTMPEAAPAADERTTPSGFIDRIQQDFPRTPSPVYPASVLAPGAGRPPNPLGFLNLDTSAAPASQEPRVTSIPPNLSLIHISEPTRPY